MSRRLSSYQKQARILHRRAEQLRQEKVNPLYEGMTIIDGMTQPRTMPKNYKNFAREGYTNDTVFKVINYGITNGAAIQPVLYLNKAEAGKPNGKRIDNHPLLDKLARPNPEQSGVFYRKSVLGYFLIAGNSFQYAVRAAKVGPPDELWTLTPDLVHPIPDQKRGIIGYQYDNWPKEKNPIPPQLIGHTRTWNPNDEFFGMSAIEVIAMLIDTQKDGRVWNLSLLQNFLKPPGAWTTTAMLAPNDRQKLEARINEKMAGARNAGKTPVLDGALEFKPSAVNPSEMDWIESMKYNSGSMANVYNMPPELIGDTSASTFNNKEMAEIFSYTEYIFPTLDDVYDTWNMWLVPMYPDLCDNKGNPTAYLYYDKESVEVIQKMIQAQKDAKADRANKLWLSGLAMQSEAQEMAGLQINKQGNVYRFGAILVAEDAVADYAKQSLAEPAAPPMPQPEPLPPPGTLPGQQPPAQPPQEKPDANNAPNNPDKQPSKPTGKQPDSNADNQTGGKGRVLRSTKALDLSTVEEKRAYAASIETARRRHEDEYEKQLAAHFDTERKAVVAALKSSSASSEHVLAARAEGAVNDQQSALKDILMDLYQDVSVDIGGAVASQLSGKKGFVSDFIKLFGDSQLKYLLLLAGQKIKDISNTTLAKIRLELTDGVAQGESIPELAKRIDSLYLDQIIPNRSTTIARTEVVASSNYASIEAAKQSELTLTKVWLATGDHRTRPWHAAADGQEVPMDQPFSVGGEDMDYPGADGSAANTVNCRCTVFYRRAASQADGSSDGSEEEKRIKRDAYKRFMDEVLV